MIRALNKEGDSKRALYEYDDSIIALLYAKTLQPDSPLILTNLGNSYIDKKIFDKAEVCYREALKYDKDFGSAHEGMARVYIHKKDGKRAIDELIKAGKFGFSPEEVIELLDSEEFATLKNVRIIGLMGMATNTDSETQIRKEFKGLRAFFDSLKTRETDRVTMRELSMGMSGDYRIAVEEGSTLVRVGSAIFGARG